MSAVNRHNDSSRPKLFAAFWKLNYLGIVFGVVFVGFSLTPSLLPRDTLLQSIVSGLSFAVGYGAGVFFSWLARKVCSVWLRRSKEKGQHSDTRTLSGPLVFSRKVRRIAWGVLALSLVIYAAAFLPHAIAWQNLSRELVGLGPLTSTNLVQFLPITIAVATIVLVLFRFVKRLSQLITWQLSKVIPKFVAIGSGIVLTLVSVFLIGLFLFRQGVR
jgi:uncharacterized membrane protein